MKSPEYDCDTDKCWAICGDGVRVEPEECDDGNTENGDGCSSDCSKVEEGWTCQSKADFETGEVPAELADHPVDSKCMNSDVDTSPKELGYSIGLGAVGSTATQAVSSVFSLKLGAGVWVSFNFI